MHCVVELRADVALSFQPKYISQCMEEIKTELRQDNLAVKANAVAKLTYVSYLQKIGFLLL